MNTGKESVSPQVGNGRETSRLQVYLGIASQGQGIKQYDIETLIDLSNSPYSKGRPSCMPNISGFTKGIKPQVVREVMSAIAASQDAKQAVKLKKGRSQ